MTPSEMRKRGMKMGKVDPFARVAFGEAVRIILSETMFLLFLAALVVGIALGIPKMPGMEMGGRGSGHSRG